MAEATDKTDQGVLPEWVSQLRGADALLGQPLAVQAGDDHWATQFWLHANSSEREGVVDPLVYVYAGSQAVHDIEARVDRLAAAAREQGHSWTEIGRALGVTKQTAWARLAKKVVAEGKTKFVEEAGGGEVFVRSKDDITAGDGVKRDVLDGKAVASTTTTSNIFSLLARNGLPTHFIGRVDDTTFRARDVAMIPLELVARRYAAGSFLDRFPDLCDGAPFKVLQFEIFEKDDAQHDPLLQFDFDARVLRRVVPNAKAAEAMGTGVRAGDLLSEEPLDASRFPDVTPELVTRLRGLTTSAFEIIEHAWKQQGGVYVDFKTECGFDRETGELLIADVIDSDSGRLRFDGVDMSKQSYRDGTSTLPQIKKKFDDVAALTDRFDGTDVSTGRSPR